MRQAATVFVLRSLQRLVVGHRSIWRGRLLRSRQDPTACRVVVLAVSDERTFLFLDVPEWNGEFR